MWNHWSTNTEFWFSRNRMKWCNSLIQNKSRTKPSGLAKTEVFNSNWILFRRNIVNILPEWAYSTEQYHLIVDGNLISSLLLLGSLANMVSNWLNFPKTVILLFSSDVYLQEWPNFEETVSTRSFCYSFKSNRPFPIHVQLSTRRTII